MPFVPNIIGFWFITAMSFVIMIASTMFTISIFMVVQKQTPAHLLGKIMAAIIAISSCSQPIGQALFGEGRLLNIRCHLNGVRIEYRILLSSVIRVFRVETVKDEEDSRDF